MLPGNITESVNLWPLYLSQRKTFEVDRINVDIFADKDRLALTLDTLPEPGDRLIIQGILTFVQKAHYEKWGRHNILADIFCNVKKLRELLTYRKEEIK